MKKKKNYTCIANKSFDKLFKWSSIQTEKLNSTTKVNAMNRNSLLLKTKINMQWHGGS